MKIKYTTKLPHLSKLKVGQKLKIFNFGGPLPFPATLEILSQNPEENQLGFKITGLNQHRESFTVTDNRRSYNDYIFNHFELIP